MRYLITGGAGFIGSHLAESLLHAGHEVDVLDDLSTGAIRNLAHLKSNPKLRYTVDSLFNQPLLAEMVDQADVVYHLAAAVGVFMIVERPVQTIETNLKTTDLVLQCVAKKRKPVFIASTSEVYGKSAKVPFSEEDDLTLGPTTKSRWSYACSKMIDEFLALAYWREKRVPTVIGRFFNTVGPRQTGQYGMVIPRFVSQALAGKPITIYGDGKQTRCFCHVADVVGAIVSLMNEPRAFGQIFNIGSDAEITINDLAETVRVKIQPALPLRHIPYDEAYEQGFEDMRRRVPDLTKIRDLIGYRVNHTIDRILDDVIAFARSQREIAQEQKA
jgi:UDP-glucose 4-epimerase